MNKNKPHTIAGRGFLRKFEIPLNQIYMSKLQHLTLPKSSGIYIIRNSINPNVYIGQASNIYNRVRWHLCELKKDKHPNPKLQRFVNKYGIDNISFAVLELVEKDKIKLCEREQFHMDQHCIKFNIAKSSFSTLGVKKSLEERRKMSERQKGKKQSPEQIRAAAIGRTGVKHSFRTKEHCRKISEARKGKPSPLRGEKMSDEFRAKLRNIALNRPPVTDEFRNKMSKVTSGVNNGMFGVNQSEETKEKIRQRHLSINAKKREAEGVVVDKLCGCCGEKKLLKEFHKKVSGKYGVNYCCKKCDYEKTKQWKENNRQKARDYARNYYHEKIKSA